MKKNIIMLFFVCILFSFVLPVHANDSKVPKITKVTMDDNNGVIVFGLERVADAYCYKIYVKENGVWTFLDVLENNHINHFSSIKYNKYYTFGVSAVTKEGESPISEYEKKFIVFYDKISCNNVSNGIQLKWCAFDLATGYELYRNGVLYKTFTDPTCSTFIDTNVKNDTYYSYTLFIYGNKDEHSGIVTQCTCSIYRVKSPKITSVKSSKKSITVRWKKVFGVDCYCISYKAEGKKEKYRIVSGNQSSYTIKNLKKGKKYIVKICGKHYFKDVYGSNTYYISDWSNPRTIKVK